MESFLYSIDVGVFRWINEGWSNPFFDHFFSFITDYHNFYVVFIPLFLYLVFWGGPKGRWLILSLFLGILIADQGSAHALKAWVERVRPCNALDGVLTPAGRSAAFSFPSSHASNMGASMFLLSMAYRPWTALFASIALLVGLSRVYLGLHYPSDVLAGYFFGILCGGGAWWLVERMKISFRGEPVKTARVRVKGRKGAGKKH